MYNKIIKKQFFFFTKYFASQLYSTEKFIYHNILVLQLLKTNKFSFLQHVSFYVDPTFANVTVNIKNANQQLSFNLLHNRTKGVKPQLVRI